VAAALRVMDAELRVIGSISGDRTDLEEAVRLAAEGRLRVHVDSLPAGRSDHARRATINVRVVGTRGVDQLDGRGRGSRSDASLVLSRPTPPTALVAQTR
jgi:hypothetical protein